MTFDTPITMAPSANPRVPQAPVFYHSVDLQTRFNDIDMLGHINNSVYISFFDLGKADYMTTALGQRMEAGHVAAAIVNINASFFSPAYFNEPLRVATAVTRLSNRSFTMEQRIYNPATGDVKCTATSILAGFDPVTATAVELPAQFVDRVRAFEHWQ